MNKTIQFCFQLILFQSLFGAYHFSQHSKFYYDTYLICRFDYPTFKATVDIKERDLMNPDDPLAESGEIVFDTRLIGFVQQKGSAGSDEIISNGYSSKMSIWHDCTSDRKSVHLRLTLHPLCNLGDNCKYTTTIDLTNNWGDVLARSGFTNGVVE